MHTTVMYVRAVRMHRLVLITQHICVMHQGVYKGTNHDSFAKIYRQYEGLHMHAHACVTACIISSTHMHMCSSDRVQCRMYIRSIMRGLSP
jgi:hypothetical protein